MAILTLQLLHATTNSRAPPLLGTIPSPAGVDHYAVLGLPQDASPDEITQAWRRLVLLHHPDRVNATSAQTATSTEHGRPQDREHADIRAINEARWVLSDSQRRKQWEDAFSKGGSSEFC